MIELDGKTVLVTGGTRGIGAAIVEALVTAGAQVLVHGRTTPEEGPYAAGSPGRASTRFVAGDLALPGSGRRLWERADQEAGGIDVLVNNAGIYVPDALEADDQQWAEAWERTMQVNLIAPIAMDDGLRFAIREGGRTVGAGVVAKIIE